MLAEHPDRTLILDEVHARPIDLLPETCRLRRLVFLMPGTADEMAVCIASFQAFCEKSGRVAPAPNARQHSFDTAEHQVTWEFHTEFVSITWRGLLADKNSAPADIGLELLSAGLLIVATRVDLMNEEKIPERIIPGFRLSSLCLSVTADGGAQVATDFAPDEDLFTRFEIAAGQLDQVQRSLLVRRLLEIDCYRTLALLPLPLARRSAPDLRKIEAEMGALVSAMKYENATIARLTLEALHDLSVRSGQLAERLDYRFAAGHAYSAILQDRLAALAETHSIHGSTLHAFIGTRVDPAVATCAAMERRLNLLSGKIERAIALLNVKLGVDMQSQNAALLDSIDRHARSQFLLQRTVEGLSVIAISYYLLGIAAYLLGGPAYVWHLPKEVALTVAVPMVMLLVWLAARWVRSQHQP